jgi:teichuronic acid biosynthesis glycosyltransferase TuaC
MKVLFVRSSNMGIDPITTNQGKSLMNLGVTVEYFDLKGSGLSGYLKNIPALRRHIREFEPSLVHAHYALCGFATSLAFTRVPVGVSLMGCDVNDKKSVIPHITRFFARYFWKFVVVKSAEMFTNLNNQKAVILPNGIDFELFRLVDRPKALDALNWKNDKIHILFASDPGRHEKNFPLAEKAVTLLKDDLDNIQLHFLMDIPHERMPLYYAAANILLMTSIREGSPNVIKEAIACECPVVSTDVGDVAEITRGIANCFVVPFDHFQIRDAMRKILDNKGRSDGRKIISHLSSENIARRLLNIYKAASKP